MIKSFIVRIFNGKWYSLPLFVSIFSIFCWFLLIILPINKVTWSLLITLPITGYFVCFILGFSKIFKKQFKEAIKQCIFTVLMSTVAAVFLTVFLPKDQYKEYKGDAKNPNNVKLEMPLKLTFSGEKPLFEVKNQNVFLYDYQFPGHYKYEVFLNKIEKGKVYLKMFDLVTNRILSADEIKKSSQMEVFNLTDELREFGLSKEFEVTEGDWGDYYGSKVEVWFQPDDESQPERKLMTKYYVIQGW
ncbi:hypothetical protein [Chryseobacterium sp. MMS23-Vi53]|uniref:hypothetical protein n=1 Tax=Chryseobacterium sp. MMS23-Vi53 TaxID=3386644 RepID=UPI0039E96DEE